MRRSVKWSIAALLALAMLVAGLRAFWVLVLIVPDRAPPIEPERRALLLAADAVDQTRRNVLPRALSNFLWCQRVVPDSEVVRLMRRRAWQRLGLESRLLDAGPPEALAALYDKGRLALADGDYEAAQESLQRFVSDVPGSAAGWALLGEVRFGRGDTDAARSALEQALTLDPGDAGSAVLLAKVLRFQGDLVTAESVLTRACRVDPSNLPARNQLIQVLTQAGKAELATDIREEVERLSRLQAHVEHFRTVFARPWLPRGEILNIHLSLGAVHREAGDLPMAILQYESARVMSPDHPDALFHLPSLYRRLGLTRSAARLDERLRAISPEAATLATAVAEVPVPGDAREAWTLGERLLAAGIPTGASTYLRAARDLLGEEIPALDLSLSRAYLLTDRGDEAAQVLETLVAQSPSDLELRILAARAAYAQRNATATREAADAALAVDPGNLEMLRRRAIAAIAKGAPDQAACVREYFDTRARVALSSALPFRWLGLLSAGLIGLCWAALLFRQRARGVWWDLVIFLVVWWAWGGWLLRDLPLPERSPSFDLAQDIFLLPAVVILLAWRVLWTVVSRRRGARAVAVSLALILAMACASDPPRPAPAPQPSGNPTEAEQPEAAGAFRDVTEVAGISFVHLTGAAGERLMPETMGSGACFLDYDGDGRMDLYLVQSGPLDDSSARVGNVLYRNRGDGTFQDVTAEAEVGDTSYGMGCTCGDYDNDGDKDIYVTNFGPNVLYRNNGDGTFTDVTGAAGVGDPRWASSATWADFDGDGWLDLYVANYLEYTLDKDTPCISPNAVRMYCHPEVYPGEFDVLYRSNGDGTFADATAASGVLSNEGKGLGVVTGDLDGDGDVDLYVANDAVPNFLYLNRGDGTFEEKGMLAGVAYDGDGRSQSGMGTDAGDYDGDGDLDLFVTNFRAEYNTLYRNHGNATFTDATVPAGLGWVSLERLCFGTSFLDYDVDGWLDLVVVCGDLLDNVDLVYPGAKYLYAQPDQLLRNTRGGRFEDQSAAAGSWFSRETVSRGVALGDYDDDGDQDLLVMTSGGPAALLRNDAGQESHRLQILLEGDPLRDAVGARAVVETEGGARLMREARTAASYCSQHDPRLFFGLGDASSADVTVHWFLGGSAVFRNVPADHFLHIRQGEGIVEQRPLQGPRSTPAGAS